MILIIGGSGRIGRRVVERLLSTGEPVRVFARASSSIPSHWSAEVARGDLGDPPSLAAAAAGCSSAFLLSAMHPQLDVGETAAIDTMVGAGVNHIVKLSTTTPAPDSPISWWRAHWRAEEALRAAPVGWTILRPNGISTFLLDFAHEVAADGGFRTAAGDGAMALVHPDDVADFAVAVLTDVDAHRGRTWDLTGPRAVSYDDVAAILSGFLGTRIEHRDEDPEAALTRLLRRGLVSWEAEGMVANWTMTRDGSGEFARVTDGVERLCGRPPRTVEEFLRAEAARFVRGEHAATFPAGVVRA